MFPVSDATATTSELLRVVVSVAPSRFLQKAAKSANPNNLWLAGGMHGPDVERSSVNHSVVATQRIEQRRLVTDAVEVAA